MAQDTLPGEGASPLYLELDHVFEALGHPRRRYLMYTMLEETEWSLRELARKVASWEQDLPVEALAEEEIESMYVALYHNHVPKLVEDDIVRFSETDETVKAGSNAEQVLKALEGVGGMVDSDQEVHARGTPHERHS